jgi:prepilin-type N-terminal cleavage/methylation domain-containing protein
MENQKSKTKNQKFPRCFCRSGFTIAELLIALMITGLLLAAIAVAFSASVKNFIDNREVFLAANKARQTLTQIIPKLRTAMNVDQSSPANECAFHDASGHNWKYRYDISDKKLYLVDLGGSGTHLVCDNVTAMTFTKNATGTSVIISITVTEGSTSQTFSTAVVIRKNL